MLQNDGREGWYGGRSKGEGGRFEKEGKEKMFYQRRGMFNGKCRRNYERKERPQER